MMQLLSPEHGLAPRIDMAENGILLDKGVHAKLGKGMVALIKV